MHARQHPQHSRDRHLREAATILSPSRDERSVARDIRRATTEAGRLGRLNALFTDTELSCVLCYRFGHHARELRARRRVTGSLAMVIYKIWHRRATHRHHCMISDRAQIGPGFRLVHRHGVMIGAAVIGADCQIHQNVTIGERVAEGDHGVPHIGDRVWIGPGATIVGPIAIGDGSTISAGTVLSRDVPPRSLVAGNPGRVIAQDYDNSRFLPRSAADTPRRSA